MPENHPFPQAVNDARTMQAALSLGRRLDLWSLLLAVLAGWARDPLAAGASSASAAPSTGLSAPALLAASALFTA